MQEGKKSRRNGGYLPSRNDIVKRVSEPRAIDSRVDEPDSALAYSTSSVVDYGEECTDDGC